MNKNVLVYVFDKNVEKKFWAVSRTLYKVTRMIFWGEEQQPDYLATEERCAVNSKGVISQ